MATPEVQREDLSAAVGARRELGADSEREVVEAFLNRVGTAIDARVDQRLAEQRREKRAPSSSRGAIPLALGSMRIGIAATGAASGSTTARRSPSSSGSSSARSTSRTRWVLRR
jgi:hypothetical protein